MNVTEKRETELRQFAVVDVKLPRASFCLTLLLRPILFNSLFFVQRNSTFYVDCRAGRQAGRQEIGSGFAPKIQLSEFEAVVVVMVVVGVCWWRVDCCLPFWPADGGSFT